MTREEVMELGPMELQAEIARRIGWTSVHEGYDEGSVVMRGCRPGHESIRENVTSWHESIDAALILVPTHVGTRESGKDLELFYESFLYVTGIGGGDNLYDFFRDEARSPANLAKNICRAWIMFNEQKKL